MQEAERVKQVENRKIQAEIDRARDQNAKRKMAKVQNREWDSGKESGERRGPPPKRTDSYNRAQHVSNQPTSKQSNFKTTPSKPASSKSASNEPPVSETPVNESSVNEPPVHESSVHEPISDEPSSNEPIPDPGPPEIPEIPVSVDAFSIADQENNDYSAWFTPGDTLVPKEAQEKPDYSEWFTGDTSSATQNYNSDWSTPDQSASPTGTRTESYPSSNNRGNSRGGRGRGRGRGRGDIPGGRGASNTGPRRGTGKEAHKPS